MNKVALVTGGTRGIGLAIATEFIDTGYSVVITNSRSVDEGKAAEQRLCEHGGDCRYLQFDVTREDNMNDLFDGVFRTKRSIDILVNNAGIIRDKTIAKMAYEDWKEVIDTNLNGAFLCTRGVLEYMKGTSNGRIINIGSVIGQMGNYGQSNYSASKAGLIGLTKSSALEFAKFGITVNAVAPGYIDTNMTDYIPDDIRRELINKIPLKRFGKPHEVAKLVSFLVSEHAAYITGQIFNINGGLY